MDDLRYTSDIDAPVAEPPQRVVSLVPSVTESLFDLGVGARVVAVTDYCVYPVDKVQHLPKIGGTKNPDVAQIIALAPDLVIANREENRKEDVEALQAAGVPVWVTFPRSVREAFNLLWNIMHVFDEASMVERIRSVEWVADWLERMAAQRDTECRVFVPVWYAPWMTANADTYMHDLLRVCGGTNVFADRERRYPPAAVDLGERVPHPADDARLAGRDVRYPRVTLDEIVAAQPDVVLLPSEPFTFTAEHADAIRHLDIPAARTGAVHLVDGSLLTWHGTRIAHALNTLPALMCPQEEA